MAWVEDQQRRTLPAFVICSATVGPSCSSRNSELNRASPPRAPPAPPLPAAPQVYLFSRGQVKPANKKYSQVRNDYMLSFDAAAEVEACADMDVDTSGMAARLDFISIDQLPAFVDKMVRGAGGGGGGTGEEGDAEEEERGGALCAGCSRCRLQGRAAAGGGDSAPGWLAACSRSVQTNRGPEAPSSPASPASSPSPASPRCL